MLIPIKTIHRYEGFENDLAELFHESIEFVGRKVWIDAAIEALNAAEKDKLNSLQNKSIPLSSMNSSLVFYVKDKEESTDTFLKIEIPIKL
jgi:hypothetical protein